MSNILLLPIYLNALHLEHETAVTEAMANFNRLPWSDGTRDINPNTANISEESLSPPFNNQNLILKAGVHLHWTLPDVLTRGKQERDGTTSFPAVPNRWLVTRRNGSGEKQWLVESDYLSETREGSVTIPFPANDSNKQPFRYLGRQYLLDTNNNNEPASFFKDHNLKLTAVGYEPINASKAYILFGYEKVNSTEAVFREPTFAAFYPNCHSVFGFYDNDKSITDAQYEVIGWYSNVNLDTLPNELKDFIDKFTTDYQAKHNQKPNTDKINEALKKEYNLKLDNPNDLSNTERLVCYASLTLKPNSATTATGKTSIAIGNTGTEALSAWVANEIAADKKSVIEEMLESVHLMPHLEHRQLDIGPKFREARHEKGFRGLPAGIIWTVRAQSQSSDPKIKATDIAKDHADNQQITLPEAIAHQLNALNLAQQQYQQALDEIESMRFQLFSDWYKYMLCAYPPDDARYDYPDIDEVKHFVQVKGIEPLRQKIQETLGLQNVYHAAPTQDELKQLESAYNTLKTHLDDASDKLTNLIEAATDKPNAIAKMASQQILNLPSWQNKALVLLPSMLAFLPNIVALVTNNINSINDSPLESLKKEVITAFNEVNTVLNNATLVKLKTCPVYQKLNTLKVALGFHNQTVNNKVKWIIQPVLAPRYWQPADPVVLITGDAVAITNHDLQIEGHVWQLSTDFTDSANPASNTTIRDEIKGQLTTLTPASGQTKFGFYNWEKQPWQPFLLAWEVEYFPLKNQGNLAPDRSGYADDYLTANYTLAENASDLSLLTDDKNFAKGANIYSGRVLLSPHASFSLKKNIEAYFIQTANLKEGNSALLENFVSWLNSYLQNGHKWFVNVPKLTITINTQEDISPFVTTCCELLNELKSAQQTYNQNRLDPSTSAADIFLESLKNKISTDGLTQFYKNAKIPPKAQNDAVLKQHLIELATWYQEQLSTTLNAVVLTEAYKKVKDLNSLSQALGGFNEALLMRKLTMQLPIEDPLAFPDYHAFTHLVQTAVGWATKTAPLPLNDFNPIRAGKMKIMQLRLVDTFGQIKDVSFNLVTSTELMPTQEDNRSIMLPPRLVQPARLNFRWLSAKSINDQDEPEMNAHPATTPICGWMVPNNLDSSLMCYDNEGKALGSITQTAEWKPAPGDPTPVESISDIENSHLRKVCEKISTNGTDFMSSFLSMLDSALENIDPEGFVQHEGLALLMGRPIAVVRASLKLELQGQPAINESWNVFRQDLGRNTRETDNVTRVKFPVRIGEFEQLNDGLVGYWKETEAGELEQTFYAPQSTEGTEKHDNIKSSSAAPLNINLTVAVPQLLTMLVDPRGKIHATGGLFPTKDISIPPDQYAAALKAIEVTFLTTPILTSKGAMSLPLPTEPGYHWSWLEKQANNWSSISVIPTIAKAKFVEKYNEGDFNDGETVWETLLSPANGWLKLIKDDPETKAVVIPKDQRKRQVINNYDEKQTQHLEQVLDLYQTRISPPNLTATFAGPSSEIREGWLKFAHTEASSTKESTS